MGRSLPGVGSPTQRNVILSGGYRAVRDCWRRQIDKRAAEKISAGQSAGSKPEEPLI
ncbi:DUF1378 family protein [Escherichia coli]|nr:DUF1378 family protein [Escherichia coli]EIG3977486.1 DUF1378 family protein [Escherichia coli]